MTSFRLTDSSLRLRIAEPNDNEVLFKIYQTSYAAIALAAGHFDEQQKMILLELQFKAQNNFYYQQFPAANFWVIEKEGKVIGLLFLDVQSNAVHIINIGLVEAFRNKGIGTEIVKDVINFAHSNGKNVTLHVETANPAFQLYKRLGFTVTGTANGFNYAMEYTTKNNENVHHS